RGRLCREVRILDPRPGIREVGDLRAEAFHRRLQAALDTAQGGAVGRDRVDRVFQGLQRGLRIFLRIDVEVGVFEAQGLQVGGSNLDVNGLALAGAGLDRDLDRRGRARASRTARTVQQVDAVEGGALGDVADLLLELIDFSLDAFAILLLDG